MAKSMLMAAFGIVLGQIGIDWGALRTSPLETQATAPPVALLQVPPAGASDGMRIGVLLPVFTPIVGSRVVELPRGGARVSLAVGITVVAMPLAPLGGVGARGDRGHDSDRQQAGDDKSHGLLRILQSRPRQ